MVCLLLRTCFNLTTVLDMKSITHSQNHFPILDHMIRLISDILTPKDHSNANSHKRIADIKESIKPLKKEKNHNLEKEFIKSIIHEQKNHIHTINGLSQILRNEEKYNLSPSERIEYLNHIGESINDLNELVSDLLDVSLGNNEDNTFTVDLNKEIDIKNLITKSIKLSRNHAISRGIHITSEINNEISLIRLDEKRIKQILANLISNAIKYSPENTNIKISAITTVENRKEYLEITVSDQGFGMTKEQINLAFEKYKTISNPNSGKVDSFGLGLPIVKELVELQNGIIEVRSEPSKGTDFILRFPY